jgi:single-stranded DNA-binding protein
MEIIKPMFQQIKVSRATGNVVESNDDLFLRSVGEGDNKTKVLNFTLAVNNFAPEGTPQEKRTTSFLRVSAWGRDAENLKLYLTKGKPLAVMGRLELKPYQSKKFVDVSGNPAIMLSPELRMEPNGFEFISIYSPRPGEYPTPEQPLSEQLVPIENVIEAEVEVSPPARRRSSRRSAKTSSTMPIDSTSIVEVVKQTGPF